MNVLSFFAHPDDETMLSGGIFALLARGGARIHYLCATRGEGGEAGEPPVCSLEELGAVREQEMRCAVGALGGGSLRFLNYIDPRVGPDDSLFAYTEDVEELSRWIKAALLEWEINVLVSHGSNGEYGHPAHVLSHQAARQALLELGDAAPAFYTAAACFPGHPRPRLANQDDEADLVVDVSPVLAQKTQAALCHLSQNALFVRRPSQESGRKMTVPEVIMTLESLHLVRDAGSGKPAEELVQILAPYLVDPASLEGECSEEAGQA